MKTDAELAARLAAELGLLLKVDEPDKGKVVGVEDEPWNALDRVWARLAEVTAERDNERQIARNCEHELAKSLMEARAEIERLKGERDALRKAKACEREFKEMAKKEANELQAELERLREALRWIPISEKLPGEGLGVVFHTSADLLRIGKRRGDWFEFSISEESFCWHISEIKDWRAAAALGADEGRDGNDNQRSCKTRDQ